MTLSTDKTPDQIIQMILKNEGGYVHHPNDRGGATNFGVTAREYGVYKKLGRAATPAEVKAMLISEAVDIFKTKYYLAPGIDKLPPVLQPIVTDAAVLYGPKRAIIFLQTVLNKARVDYPDPEKKVLSVDGSIGPATIERAKQEAREYAPTIVNSYVDERIRFCEAIVRNRPEQAVFLKGWKNRANKFRIKA
jgi:lysozyme family protein